MPTESHHPDPAATAAGALVGYRRLVDRGVDRTIALVCVLESYPMSDDDAGIAATFRALLEQQAADLAAERERVNRLLKP